jgi:hypothetical protein
LSLSFEPISNTRVEQSGHERKQQALVQRPTESESQLPAEAHVSSVPPLSAAFIAIVSTERPVTNSVPPVSSMSAIPGSRGCGGGPLDTLSIGLHGVVSHRELRGDEQILTGKAVSHVNSGDQRVWDPGDLYCPSNVAAFRFRVGAGTRGAAMAPVVSV